MISIIKTPLQYTPAYNPIVFSVSGSSDTVLFKASIIEAESLATVFTGNIYPTPLNPTVANINLTKQLSSLVFPDIDNTSDVAITKPNNIIGYKLNLVDYGVTSGGTLDQLSTGLTTDTFYAYDGKMDIQNFAVTNFSNVISDGHQANFLTLQPNFKPVNDFSTEQLYFLQDGYESTGLNVIVGIGNHNQIITLSGSTVEIPETQAVATVTVTQTPLTTSGTTIQVIEPLRTVILYSGIVTYTGGINGYISNLVGHINSNTYGYVATQTSTSGYTITAPSGMGSSINTKPVYTYFYTTSGGVSGAYIFGGGVNDKPAFTGDLSKMNRINCSPSALQNAGITGLTYGTEYSIFVKDVRDNTITENGFFDIIMDSFGNLVGTLLSEKRYFKYQDTPCNLDLVNILFTNSQGGVDSIQLVNPQSSVAVSKLSIKKNNINLNADNVYETNGVYNTNDLTYDTTSKASFKVWTKTLSDEQANWLVELVNSKNIYVVLNTGELVPVQLKTTSFNPVKFKYKPLEVQVYQFEFTLSDNFLPMLSTGSSIIINS